MFLFKKKRIKQDIPHDLRLELKAAQKRKQEAAANEPQIKYSLSLDTSTIDRAVKEIKETKLEPTFKEVLFKYIDKSGMTDPEVYKKAHMDKRTFSKIRTEDDPYVSYKNAICLALALELNIDDLKKLMKAKYYTFGENDYFDIAILWCVKNKIYDIEQVNDVLYACDLDLLTKD